MAGVTTSEMQTITSALVKSYILEFVQFNASIAFTDILLRQHYTMNNTGKFEVFHKELSHIATTAKLLMKDDIEKMRKRFGTGNDITQTFNNKLHHSFRIAVA